MAYKEITALDADTTIALGGTNGKTGKPNPTRVEGYYLGSKEVESPKSKTGKSFIHYFKTKTGNVAVWGKTNLDRKLSSAKVGEMTLVIQSGTQRTANGNMYLYSVQQDDTNTIEVANTSSNSPSFNEDEGIDEDYNNDEDTYASEEVTQKAALSAAERAAKVQSLLGKRK